MRFAYDDIRKEQPLGAHGGVEWEAPDDERQVFVSFVLDLGHLDLCHWLPADRAR